MTPLDLTKAPPRSGRLELAGVVFLPRTIDKIRATLPGGELGAYAIDGFSAYMLGAIGITLVDLEACVVSAESDDDVAAYVKEHAKPEGVAQWNAGARGRKFYEESWEEAIADHPWLADHARIEYSLDFLDADDTHAFAAA